MVLADSSFLIGLFMEDDFHHGRALEIFNDLKKNNETIIVPSIILQETLTVITYKWGLEAACEVYKALQKGKMFKFYWIDEEEFYEILDFWFNLGKEISFADASLIYLSKKLNERIITFDEELLKII